MSKPIIGVALAAALLLVTFGLVGRAAQPGPEPPHLITMDASGQAMQQAGTAIQTHARAMLDQGQRAGDQTLIDYGQRWLQDGQDMVRRGQWMVANPTAPSSLHATQAELAQQGNWAEVNRAAQAMLHDPSKARGVDLEALRWNGLSMQSEGADMADHAQLMEDQVALMLAQHKVDDPAAAALRAAAATLRQTGEHLQQNGQVMVAYADRLRANLGIR